MDMNAESRVPESLLSRLWRMRLWEGRWLAVADGRRIRLLWSGQPTQDGGPDFRGAMMDFGGATVRGDVEIDLEAAMWRAHGHHLDAAFDNVVLHVVLHSGGALSTVLRNGVAVPILPLDRYLPVATEGLADWASASSPRRCPCREGGPPLTPALAIDRLEAAGDCRFLAKARRFEQELMEEAADQVLYRGIMASLGYAKHKGPFSELADRLPLAWMRRKVVL